jgi:hypothetical protein
VICVSQGKIARRFSIQHSVGTPYGTASGTSSDTPSSTKIVGELVVVISAACDG